MMPAGWGRSSVVVILTATVLRVAAGWLTGQLERPQVWEYECIADHLLAGQGFVCEHLGTPYLTLVLPIYPLLNAAVYAVTGHSQQVMLLLQCLLGALIALQVRAIGRLVFGEDRIGLWAAWLVVWHPGLVLYASLLHPLTCDVLAFLWTLWAWLRLDRRRSVVAAVHAGLATGIALLSRGNIWLFVLAAMAWVLWRAPAPRGRAVRQVLVAGAVSALVLLPWLARNTVRFGRFPVMQTTANEVFWRGNNPVASGSGYTAEGVPILHAAPASLRQRLAELDELGQSELFRREALAFIGESPGWALRLYLRKLASFWWFSGQAGLNYPAAYRLGYQAVYAMLLALIGWGSYVAWRRLARGDWGLLVAFPLAVALTQSLYYVDGRHRWTVEPALLLFAAAGLASLLTRIPRPAPAGDLDLAGRSAGVFMNRPD